MDHHTWLEGILEAMVVRPVLRVALLKTVVHLGSVLIPLQFQQHLTYMGHT